jgi:hypothetical protein
MAFVQHSAGYLPTHIDIIHFPRESSLGFGKIGCFTDEIRYGKYRDWIADLVRV